MVPPIPTTNPKSPPKQPHVIPLSQNQYDNVKFQLRRPDDHHSNQGHVHTQILVHHKPETVNLRPQSTPHLGPEHYYPPRRDYSKLHKPTEPPPRRTEIAPPNDAKPPESGNEVTILTSWKSDKKPLRISPVRRPRPTSRPRVPARGSLYSQSRPRPPGHIRYPTRAQPPRPPTKLESELTAPSRPAFIHMPTHKEQQHVPALSYNTPTQFTNQPPVRWFL